MVSPNLLVQRMKDATVAGNRAFMRKDARGWLAAKLKYERADKLLKEFEAEQARQNEELISKVEARAIARNGGVISYADLMRHGIPVEVMQKRGWANSQSGMRKVEDTHGPADDGADEEAGPQAS